MRVGKTPKLLMLKEKMILSINIYNRKKDN